MGSVPFELREEGRPQEGDRQAPDHREPKAGGLWFLGGPLLLGGLVGLLVPAPLGTGADPSPWGRVSQVLGWLYFFAWSFSFWPQILLNFRRKKCTGLSLDYQVLNWVGFGCYAAFNVTLFWSEEVKAQYASAHDGKASAVELNDVLFALHALLATTITLFQVAWYRRGTALDLALRPQPRTVVDRVIRVGVVCFCGLLVPLLTGQAIACAWLKRSTGALSWLGLLESLAEVKVVISVMKYCPQVYLNAARRSTVGWNIWNVLLDLTGGVLSVAQLLVDGASRSDWSAITGDPGKLLLGNVSIGFDLVFLVQHYCLYSAAHRGKHLPGGGGEGEPTTRALAVDPT